MLPSWVKCDFPGRSTSGSLRCNLDSDWSPSLIPAVFGYWVRWGQVTKVRCVTDISPVDMLGPQGQIRRLTDVPAVYIWSAGIRARSPDLHLRAHAMRCLPGHVLPSGLRKSHVLNASSRCTMLLDARPSYSIWLLDLWILRLGCLQYSFTGRVGRGWLAFTA